MWRYIASTSAISWGVGFFAAAAIQSRPRCDVYHVRPSTLHTHIKCHILQHFAKTQVSIGVYHIYNTHTHTLHSPYLLMPFTSSEAHGWCMLRHQPPSDISCSSLSWSLNRCRSSLPLSSIALFPFSIGFLWLSLPPTSTHWNRHSLETSVESVSMLTVLWWVKVQSKLKGFDWYFIWIYKIIQMTKEEWLKKKCHVQNGSSYLWRRLHYVGIHQISEALPSTLSFRIHWWFGHRFIAHCLEGLIQPANYWKHFRKSGCLTQPHNINLELLLWFRCCQIILLVVILIQVVSLFNYLSTSKVKCDLPVFARGMAKLSQLLFLFLQFLSLIGWQPLIGFSGKVIRLVIQNLCSSDTGVKRRQWSVITNFHHYLQQQSKCPVKV